MGIITAFKHAWRVAPKPGVGWEKSREGEGCFGVSLRKPTQASSSRFDRGERKEVLLMREHVVAGE